MINDLDRLLLTQTVAALKKLKKKTKTSIPELGIKDFAFDMGTLKRFMYDKKGNVCGTAGCLLGTMREIAASNGIDRGAVGNSINSDLFYPLDKGLIGSYDSITTRKAVKVAKHYLETGKVDWDI